MDSTIVLFLVQDAVINGAIYALVAVGLAPEIVMTVALVVPIGPMIYRLAFEPLAEASTLVLLIAAFGVHFTLTGLGLAFFGPEGVSTPALIERSFTLGDLTVTGQSLAVLASTIFLLAALGWFFKATLFGKALRACASNRLGARLVGVSTSMAGRIAFGVAALIGAVSGVLVGAISTIYYDSGFLIGLKGFVAAIMAGLASYAFAGAAALAVGLVESFSSFWASAYKEVFVFAAIIPVLVWRSLVVGHVEEEEE